jgi:hypothetical protein
MGYINWGVKLTIYLYLQVYSPKIVHGMVANTLVLLNKKKGIIS